MKAIGIASGYHGTGHGRPAAAAGPPPRPVNAGGSSGKGSAACH
jgi:hypothetical protein